LNHGAAEELAARILGPYLQGLPSLGVAAYSE